jgi:hypothetical protein
MALFHIPSTTFDINTWARSTLSEETVELDAALSAFRCDFPDFFVVGARFSKEMSLSSFSVDGLDR